MCVCVYVCLCLRGGEGMRGRGRERERVEGEWVDKRLGDVAAAMGDEGLRLPRPKVR